MTTFKPEELRYAAHSRCRCGAGLAYPKDPTVRQVREWQPRSPFNYWDTWICSAVLTGQRSEGPSVSREENTHDAYPFAFYEIKSEDQPSAAGATTRPKS